jgi:hypothetical protein
MKNWSSFFLHQFGSEVATITSESSDNNVADRILSQPFLSLSLSHTPTLTISLHLSHPSIIPGDSFQLYISPYFPPALCARGRGQENDSDDVPLVVAPFVYMRDINYPLSLSLSLSLYLSDASSLPLFLLDQSICLSLHLYCLSLSCKESERKN